MEDNLRQQKKKSTLQSSSSDTSSSSSSSSDTSSSSSLSSSSSSSNNSVNKRRKRNKHNRRKNQQHDMIELSGNGLNKKHQELNTKVNEAFKNKANFDAIKDAKEETDVDKLFKIDLASKYKNIDYNLEVLQCGDSLYISRALKCDWIVEDEFQQYINPQYLDLNIFPSMSLKMKKKLLSNLAMRLKNERAAEFYHYCMREKIINIGLKFLLNTHESFKIKILTEQPSVYRKFDIYENYVENFVGNSFKLADYLLKVCNDYNKYFDRSIQYKLRYLYSVSEVKYLDLVENIQCRDKFCFSISVKLTRSIMKKHKHRVLKDPWLYLNILNSDVVAKYSTSEDAKVYLVPFLPEKCNDFWNTFRGKIQFIIKLIPIGERFSYVKKVFTDKYPGEMFEDDYKFFKDGHYDMMMDQEKEDWALRQVASGKESHGCDNDYIWYQFVNFPLAFAELKSYIQNTSSKSMMRYLILNVLVDCSKTNEELTTLLQYYYERHINEPREYRIGFVKRVIDRHKVINLNDECWAALDKIFHSLEVYNKQNENNKDYENYSFRALSIIYHSVNEKEVPKVLDECIHSGKMPLWSIQSVCNIKHDLDEKKCDILFQYLLQSYTTQFQIILKTNGRKKSHRLNFVVEKILDLIKIFEKTLEVIPKLVHAHIKSHFQAFKNHRLYARPKVSKFGMSDIMQYLKEDVSLVFDKFNEIKVYSQNKQRRKNINWLSRKIKIYFSHDVTENYVKLLDNCLSDEELYLRSAKVAVFGIFFCADDGSKINFLKKYAPIDPKIDYVNINRNVLTIQTAICSMACKSRPPIPLSNLLDYIKGDYLKFCIPIYDAYVANLTPNLCIEFVETTLDRPVSIQKHALRMAFQCFSIENLKQLVLKVWKKTKNVSLRKVLYKKLFVKINDGLENVTGKAELFEVLCIMTRDLNEDDDEELFELLALPSELEGQHLETFYSVVNAFRKRAINYKRLTNIVDEMICNFELMSNDGLISIMEEHINIMLNQKLLERSLIGSHNNLIAAKWRLIRRVIIVYKYVYVLNLIMYKCLEMWYTTVEDIYIYREFWTEFLFKLEVLSLKGPIGYHLELNEVVFKHILTVMEATLSYKESYVMVWELNMGIMARKVLGKYLPRILNIYGTDQASATLIAKEAILKLSIYIGDMMKQYVETNKYFSSFYTDLKDIITNTVDKVRIELKSFIHDDYELCELDALVLFCLVLSDYQVRELNMFVIHSLPINYNGTDFTEYLNVINHMKALDDEEIQCLITHRFFSSDFKYREFMP